MTSQADDRPHEVRTALACGSAFRQLRHAVGQSASVPWTAQVGGESIEIPSELLPLLMDALENLSNGTDVAVAPADLPLGTTEASRLLAVSRPWLVQLLDREELPSWRQGTKRRTSLGAVMRRRREDSERLRQAGERLAEAMSEPKAADRRKAS